MTSLESILGRNRMMWGPTIGLGLPVRAYIDGAAAAGYEHVTLAAQELRPLDDDELAALAAYGADRSVTVSQIDGFYPWLPIEGTRLEGAACSLEEILHQAEVLGSRFIGALAIKTPVTVDDMADRFAAACARVADEGRQLTLEFSPLGGVADLATAHTVVSASNFVGGGILFDTWHFSRGQPDFELLESLSGREITTVQISDAAPELVGSLWNDTLHHRRHPGDGAFDLRRLVGVLEQIGALDWYGPEVISDEQHARSAEEAGAVAARRLDDFLADVFDPG